MGAMVAEELLAYNCDVALIDEHPLPERLEREVLLIRGHADRLASNKADIEAFKPDAVVHLETKNELHAHSLIETMEGIDSHLLFASSVNVYQANARVYRTEKVDLQDWRRGVLAQRAPDSQRSVKRSTARRSGNFEERTSAHHSETSPHVWPWRSFASLVSAYFSNDRRAPIYRRSRRASELALDARLYG